MKGDFCCWTTQRAGWVCARIEVRVGGEGRIAPVPEGQLRPAGGFRRPRSPGGVCRDRIQAHHQAHSVT
jgi:hypothetical protein